MLHTSDSQTKLESDQSYLRWFSARFVEVALRGLPTFKWAVRFHLDPRVPVRIEIPEGATMETESRKFEAAKVMISMTQDQAKVLYKLLEQIPGVGPGERPKRNRLVLPSGGWR